MKKTLVTLTIAGLLLAVSPALADTTTASNTSTVRAEKTALVEQLKNLNINVIKDLL